MNPASPNRLGKLAQYLGSPVDAASLVFFRIAFGGIMLWEVYRYFSKGWIEKYYVEPQFFFKYFGFEWIQPWAGQGMNIHFAVLGILAIFIMIGFLYRLSAIAFFLGFTYVFLLDQTRYLNHFYLISLISFLLIFISPNRCFSVDAILFPWIRSRTVPTWSLWLIRFQVAVPYFYGGLAKLNKDWLHAEPVRSWFTDMGNIPLIGEFLTTDWFAYAFAYGGLLFDLFIVPLLLWKRTRLLAFILAVLFHVTNAIVFQIGIFPWFMIAATLIFFSPSWPRQFFLWIPKEQRALQLSSAKSTTPMHAIAFVALTVYVGFQILFPFRHWLYPGNVSWTEEGHRFSWHMKLRRKRANGHFLVTDLITGKTWKISPRGYLTSKQTRKMMKRPDMILQFAQFLADKWRRDGHPQVEVNALIQASLNNGPYLTLIQPGADLAREPRNLWTASWITRPNKTSN